MSFGDDTPERERARLIGLALALVTLLVYLPVAFHDFIFFDDPAYVSDNPVVQNGLSWAGLKWAFAGWHASNWHPVTWLSHMLDCQLFGLNPGAQHFINALLHAVNAVFLYQLWRRLTGTVWPSALVAALFAWHPLHVESVAWLAERKDLLSTLFGLLATLAYANYAREARAPAARRGNYIAALLWFVLSLLSKPMLVTLPFVFLLLDFWPLKRIGLPWTQEKAAGLVAGKTPFFLLAAASCLVTFLAQRGEAVMSVPGRPLGLRLENAVLTPVEYLFKIFCPVRLGVLYPLPDGYAAGEVAVAAGLLAAAGVLIWRHRARSPWLLTGWLWFLGTLAPVIGLVQVGNQAYADRYTYWPAIGLFVAVVFAGADAVARKPVRRVPAAILTGLVLCACAVATERQLGFWKDTKTLFSHTLAVTGKNPVAEMMLGVGYERSGGAAEAIRCYQEALKLDPSLKVQMPGGTQRRLAVQATLLAAQLAEQNGGQAKAMALYRAALDLDPTVVEAHNNLANLLEAAGARQESLAHYQAAVHLAPAEALAHDNLGTELLILGRFADAMQEYKEAARLQPDDPRAYFLMGKAYLQQGQTVAALAGFRAAVERDGDDPRSLALLARILATDENATNRDGKAAVTLAEKANTQTGGVQPFILDVLSLAYAEAGRFEDAQRSANRAIELAEAAKLPALADDIRQHLDLFQAGLPCHEASTNVLPNPPTLSAGPTEK